MSAEAVLDPHPPAAPPAAPAAPAAPEATGDQCPSCGAARPDQFCGRCGEARVAPDDLTLRAFARHAVEQFTNLDAALWHTVRALALRPGQLTADWLAGRRRGAVKPLQLFVLANVAFFLLLKAAGGGFRFRVEQYESGRLGSVFLGDSTAVRATVARKAAGEGITVAAYRAKFNAASAGQQSVWLLLAPTVAGVLALLYARRRLPYVQHLVFAVHFLAFMLLFLACWIGGAGLLVRGAYAGAVAVLDPGPLRERVVDALVWVSNDEAVTGYPALVVLSVYLFRALRRVYPEPWGWTLARTALLGWSLPRMFDVYRDVLFVVTLWTT